MFLALETLRYVPNFPYLACQKKTPLPERNIFLAEYLAFHLHNC